MSRFCAIEIAMPFCAIEVVMPFVQLKLICLLVSTWNVYDQVGNALEQLYLKFLFIYYWELQCSCSLQHFEFADFGWLQEIHYPLWNSCHLVLEMMGVYILELVVMAILYFTITVLLNGQYAFFFPEVVNTSIWPAMHKYMLVFQLTDANIST